MQTLLKETKYWYLANHKLFSDLPEESINELSIISNYKKLLKNDRIDFSENEKKKVYSIKEGTLKICCQNEKGKEIILEMLVEGDLFGQITLDDKITKNNEEYAIVLTDELKLCSFETDQLKLVLEKNPDLSIRYTNSVTDKLNSFQNKYIDLIFKDAYTRVADFFKRYAHYSVGVSSKRAEMRMLLTHQEIGDYTAISRQTVTDIINSLEQEGKIVYLDRKNVIIPDIDKL